MIPKNSYPKSSLIIAESQTGKGDVAPISQRNLALPGMPSIAMRQDFHGLRWKPCATLPTSTNAPWTTFSEEPKSKELPRRSPSIPKETKYPWISFSP